MPSCLTQITPGEPLLTAAEFQRFGNVLPEIGHGARASSEKAEAAKSTAC